MLFVVWSLPILAVSPSANAAIYQWKVSPFGMETKRFPNPNAACEYAYTSISSNWDKKIEPD
ncbi:TPA: DUF6531 domain-containing protein, partial [Pseudomonas aeruginosa]